MGDCQNYNLKDVFCSDVSCEWTGNQVQLIAVKLITIPLPGGVVDAFYRLNMIIFVLFVGYEKWQINNMKRIYLWYNKNR